MSFNQVLKQSGVEHAYRFNTLTNNWVLALKRAESEGLKLQAIKVGDKRVALAANQMPKRRGMWLPIVASLVAVTCILIFNWQQPQIRSVKKALPEMCAQLQVGDQMFASEGNLISGSWKIDVQDSWALGNLEYFEITAKCLDKSFTGSVVSIRSKDGITIKKLTPTK